MQFVGFQKSQIMGNQLPNPQGIILIEYFSIYY
jgi:hypothetical protein